MSEPKTRASDIKRKIDRGEIKIVYACRDRVLALRQWVQKVLDAVGHPEAFITNESTLSDFWSRSERAAAAEEVGKKLGMRVDPGEYVIDVASKLRLKSLQ